MIYKILLATLSAAAIVLPLATGHAAEPQPGAPGPKTQVGAGTTDETTTGISGRSHDNAGGAKTPQASQCDTYSGESHDYCLYTILKQAPVPKGG